MKINGARASDNMRLLVPCLIAAATLAAFLPALENGFVNWDDDVNFLNNPEYRGLGWNQLVWMFTTFHMSLYRPVTWVTFGMDYLLWGMEPFGYHLTSLVIHVANAVVFYRIARRLIGFAFEGAQESEMILLEISAGFAALLFSIHPLRVEAVVWLSARNDIVSGFFFLVSIYFYLGYAQPLQAGKTDFKFLTFAVLAYVLSLLSKGMGITLPAVLLLLDFYPLRRLGWERGSFFAKDPKKILLEKLPFILLAAAASVLALVGKQEYHILWSLKEYGAAARATQFLFGLAFYLWKTVAPWGLSPLYEVRGFEPSSWQFVASVSTVSLVGLIVLMTRKRWPAGPVSALYYATILAPVSGIAQFGKQAVADRYSYLACLGWALLLGGCLLGILQSRNKRRINRTIWSLGTAASALIVIWLGTLTWGQTRVWHDSEVLWKHAITLDQESSIAHNQLGNVLADRNALEEAIEQYRQALRINPANAGAQYNLAMALDDRGDLDGAIQHYEDTLRLDPTHAYAHNNLGAILFQRGELDRAIDHFQQALKARPELAQARDNLSRALAVRAKTEKAAP